MSFPTKQGGDGVHSSNNSDFGIVGIRLLDDGLDLFDALGLLELGVLDIKLDFVVPIDECRHFG